MMVKQGSIIFISYVGTELRHNVCFAWILKIFIGDCGESRPQTTLEIIMLHGVCFNGQSYWFSDIL